MFDYNHCGKHIGKPWYEATPCPECEKQHTIDIDHTYEAAYNQGRHDEQVNWKKWNASKLNPGKPLTEHQIDRLE